ncbi:SGNH/GDSL hydrolase family protein [Phaeacidiphilus oryzae]|uniref:SGNH/GDSL hydrolase family protein n=1 Tax=Phaeacidiphilus oryzae TaxID=348818 RepID=UPI00055F14CA|nr:SGNH/GDSL hydrolase family protein [Phaeacidiphilus oryzae]
MRVRALLMAVAAATALSLLGPAQAPNASAAAAPTGYVALGDSYSAGVGAGAYDPASGACKRSTSAFPELWAASHPGTPFVSVACLGATTRSVETAQLSALRPSTALISLTAGGNDAGFADTLESCVLHGDAACGKAVTAADGLIDRQLPGRLAELYRRIRAAAPAARVVVLGYPHLYQRPGDCPFGIADASRAALNTAADRLDAVIAAAAAHAGFRYADVRRAFTGHEVCSSQPWLHSVAYPLETSYHPTRTGQSLGYLPVFAAAAGA